MLKETKTAQASRQTFWILRTTRYTCTKPSPDRISFILAADNAKFPGWIVCTRSGQTDLWSMTVANNHVQDKTVYFPHHSSQCHFSNSCGRKVLVWPVLSFASMSRQISTNVRTTRAWRRIYVWTVAVRTQKETTYVSAILASDPTQPGKCVTVRRLLLDP